MTPTPDFIGVGAPRCATTWIFEALRYHPNLWLPEEKSLQYFNNHYQRSEAWYCKNFNNHGSNDILGEYTPGYFTCPKCPERIYKFNPDIKIIVSLRDPIERSYSAYKHHIRKGEHNLSFRKALETKQYRNTYLEPSKYCKYIKRFLNYFDHDQIKVVTVEEVASKPKETIQLLYSFLGVRENITPGVINRKVNKGISQNGNSIRTIALRLMDRVNNVRAFRNWKNWLLSIGRVRRLLNRVFFESARESVDKNTVRVLRPELEEDIICLEKVLDNNITEKWHYC